MLPKPIETKFSLNDVYSENEIHALMNIGSQNTEGIFSIARMVNAKIELGFPSMLVYKATGKYVQKSTSSIKSYYYCYKFYREQGLARYAGLSYSHLSWAMSKVNPYDILDWCVDENASVDRMKAYWINAEESPYSIEKFVRLIQEVIVKLRYFKTDHPKKNVWLAQLQDILDDINKGG